MTLVNGSPRLPRIQVPSVKDQESFDITLHRKDNEGFGFVILTSKSKPPPGGNSRFIDIIYIKCLSLGFGIKNQFLFKRLYTYILFYVIFSFLPHNTMTLLPAPAFHC